MTTAAQALALAHRHWRPGAWALACALAALAPAVSGAYGDYLLSAFAGTSIVVLSLTLLVGLAGQLSLAQSAFVGGGAYTAALLESHFGSSLWATIPAAVAAGFALGALVGLPALRLSGAYLAISTLGLAAVADSLLFHLPQLGGLGGLALHRPALPVDMKDARTFAYLCLALLALVLFSLWRLRDARTGWWLQAIRDDERAARAAGIDVPIYKLLAFAWSGGAAALGGCLLGYLSLHVNPLDFAALSSVGYLAVAVVTGVRRLTGALAGGALYVLVPQLAGATGPRFAPAFSVVLPALLVAGVALLVHGERLRRLLERVLEKRWERVAAQG